MVPAAFYHSSGYSIVHRPRLPILLRGLLACTRQPIPLEMKNEASGSAQIALRLIVHAGLGEAGHQVFHLKRAGGKAVTQFDIESAADGHGEGVVR